MQRLTIEFLICAVESNDGRRGDDMKLSRVTGHASPLLLLAEINSRAADVCGRRGDNMKLSRVAGDSGRGGDCDICYQYQCSVELSSRAGEYHSDRGDTCSPNLT